MFFPCSVGKSRGVLKTVLLGVTVGVPLVVGVRYAISEPRERRKMKILAEGIGRFCRYVEFFLYYSMVNMLFTL